MYVNRTKNSDIDPLAHGALPDKLARPSGGSGRAYAVDTDPVGYVRKALSLSAEPAAEFVSQARTLLASGWLDSPAAVKQAAAKLASRGI